MKTYLIFITSFVLLMNISCKSKNDELSEYNNRIKNNPNDPWEYHLRGFYYLRYNKFAEAVKDFEKSLSIYKSSISYYNLSLAYLGLFKVKLAYESANEAIKSAPHLTKYYDSRGVCNDLLNNKEAAIKDYSKFLEEPYQKKFLSMYTVVYFRRSFLYYEKGKYSEALNDINYAMSISKDDGALSFLRYLINLKLKSYSSALSDLQSALKKGIFDQDWIEKSLININGKNRIEVHNILEKYKAKNRVTKKFLLNDKKYIIRKFLDL